MEVGDYGIFQLTGSVDGPISDTFGLRADGVAWSNDGFYDNTISGADVGGGEGYGLALTGVYEPSDTFKLKFRAAYSDDEFDPRPEVMIFGDSQEDVTVYPPSAIAAGIGTPGAFELPFPPFTPTATGLTLFDLFCPNGPNERGGVPLPAGTPYDPVTDSSLLSSSGPGFCVPKTMGDADGRQVTLSENTVTGGEYPGSTMELFRTSLVMSWDLGTDSRGGTLSSYTGYTDADTSDFLDQDLQARGRPDTLLVNWQTQTATETKQFSQEIRWASNFDGPVQLTVGGLYWDQTLHTDDQNYIINCLPYANDLAGGVRGQEPSICDGTQGPDGNTGPPNFIPFVQPVSVSSWQQYAD